MGDEEKVVMMTKDVDMGEVDTSPLKNKFKVIVNKPIVSNKHSGVHVAA